MSLNRDRAGLSGKITLTFLLIFFFITTILYAQEKRYNLPVEGSPSYGPPDAPVTIIEFLDYQ